MTRISLLLALAVSAPAAAQTPELYRPDSTPPAAVHLTGTVEVPLLPSQVGRAPLPVVNVMINGKGPFRFGIETGAHFIAVSPAVAGQLGLKAVGGPAESPEYLVDSIAVGGATFITVHASGLAGASGVDGLLGWPFWTGVLMTIDYPAGKLRISGDSLPVPNGKDILPLSRVGDFWGAPMNAAGHQFTAVVDTRSTGGFGFTPTSADGLPFDSAPVVIGRAGGAAIAPVEVKGTAINGDITLGGYTFAHPRIAIRPLPPLFPQAPIIGAQVLSTFVMSLDVARGRVRLER